MLFGLLEAAPEDMPLWPVALPWVPIGLLLLCVLIDEPACDPTLFWLLMEPLWSLGFGAGRVVELWPAVELDGTELVDWDDPGAVVVVVLCVVVVLV